MTRTPEQRQLLLDTLVHVRELYRRQRFYDRDDDYAGPIWNQGDWLDAKRDAVIDTDSFACEAAGCFAGWAALKAGAYPTGVGGIVWPKKTPRLLRSGDVVMQREGGAAVHVAEYAAQQLGITDYGVDFSEASALFNASNSIDDLTHIVANLLADRHPKQGRLISHKWDFDAEQELGLDTLEVPA